MTPQVNGKAVGNLYATVPLKVGQTPDGAHSKFVADRQSITADGQDSATLTFTAKDAQGQPMPGIARALRFQVLDRDDNPAAPGAVTMMPITESATPGVYTAQLSGKKTGSYQVIPQINGKAVGDLNATVTLMAFATAVQDI
ncbi:Ig-like domain-containing protein [Serratia symbiotica]|uniref:Ig-like domain-containing protein n=1 Tax=Serratia symbiotica TaxID=138074 RepID=UPI00077B8906|nr:Ig-like domain-containing protein [Serratia symbiotica]